MKYVIVLILFLALCWIPVEAASTGADGYINAYEPSTKVDVRAHSDPVLREHVAKSGSPRIADKIEIQQHEMRQEQFILPGLVQWLGTGLSNGVHVVGIWYQHSVERIGHLLNSRSVQTRKQPVAKKTKTSLPTLEPVGGAYSRFTADPFSAAIPSKIKEVYTWDRLWNPVYNPQNYLQCTTFVAMVYNLNGVSLKGKVSGDAKTWIGYTNTFQVYENGHTTELPQVFDIAVWATNGANHVGVITAVSDTQVTIINANASQPSFTYAVSVAGDGVVTLSGNSGWVPSHWMRLKE